MAGGIRLKDSAADLAIAIALYSARTDLLPNQGLCFAGEISLAGEIRLVKKLLLRTKMAASSGLQAILTSDQTEKEAKDELSSVNIAKHHCKNLQECIAKAFGK